MVSLQRAFAYTKVSSQVVTGETSDPYWVTMEFDGEWPNVKREA
jgi:hypothetical protein